MRFSIRLAITMGTVAAVAAVVAVLGAQAQAAGCPDGRVLKIADGERRCVPAAHFRPSADPESPLTAEVRRVSSGWPLPPRLRSGGAPGRTVRRPVLAAVVDRVASSEAELGTAMRARLGQASARRAHAVPGGSPTVSVAANGTVTGSIPFEGSVSGSTVSGRLDMTMEQNGRAGSSLEVSVTDPSGGTRSWGFTLRQGRGGGTCPVNGILDLSSDVEVTTRSGETFGPRQIGLGRVREAHRIRVRSRARVPFGRDGRARPFTVSIDVSLAYRRDARALFLANRGRLSMTGTMTGTVDPRSGAVTGGTVRTSIQAVGMDGSQAEAEAAARDALEKIVRDELGRMLANIREAEERCGGYEVALDLTSVMPPTGYTGQGRVVGTATAPRDNPGSTPARFTGVLAVVYQDLVFTSLVAECVMVNPISSNGTFEVKLIRDLKADVLHVSWGIAGPLFATATILCNGVPVPGQPGPAFIGATPTSFDVPLEGGLTPIGGGTGGFTQSGSIIVTRREN